MNIDQIETGIVLDHIQAKRGIEIYRLLDLDSYDGTVALIRNVKSKKMGRKDILKIDQVIELDLAVLGYVDPGITVNIIRGGVLVEKRHIELPEIIRNVISCNNPRCITSTEQGLDQVFKLSDREKRMYRCVYCEESRQ